MLIPSFASLEIAQTQPTSDVTKPGKHAWQFVNSIRSPSGLIKAMNMLLQNPKNGISPHKLLTQEEVYCTEAPQHSLLIPHHTVFGHLKLLATTFVAKAMLQIEEPGKVAYKILAKALEVHLRVGKSYKYLLSTRSFLALLFHFTHIQHVFTVRCHTRTNITPAAGPK